MTKAELKKIAESELVTSFHKRDEMTFSAIPVWKIKNLPKVMIHKSKSWNGRQSSEYHVAEINGRPAYLRKSNHWGFFTTTEGENIKYHEWELYGGERRADGKYKNTSQAGFIYIG